MKYLCEDLSEFVGKPVRVYKNLHKEKYSIQSKNAKGCWVVIHHADKVTLQNATFKVSEVGRQRVMVKRQKNVHAFIYGTLITNQAYLGQTAAYVDSFNYNPYEFPYFRIDGTWDKVEQADYVFLEKGRKIACNPH